MWDGRMLVHSTLLYVPPMRKGHFDLENYNHDDRRSQRALYDHLLPYLRAIVNRYLKNQDDVLDVLQEAFIKIFKNLGNYDSSKGDLKAWSARIAINTALNYNRKNKSDDVDITELQIGYTNPDVWDKMSNDDMLRILKAMPTKYFEVFNLYIIDGYSHEEISELLGISVVSSRKRLSRSREWIQKTFKIEGQSVIKYGFAAINAS